MILVFDDFIKFHIFSVWDMQKALNGAQWEVMSTVDA